MKGYHVACRRDAFPLHFLAMKADPCSTTLTPESPSPGGDALWQRILDQVPASLFVKDREGRYRLINQACERLLGIPRERILGKTAQEVLPPELANQFLANDLQVLATEAPHRFEVIIPQAGGLHTFESLQFPLRDSQGECHAFCGISIDITARKHAEQQAQQTTAQRLGALIEQGLAGVVEVDLAGRIRRCNQRYCEIVGHDQQTLLGGRLSDFTSPEDWRRGNRSRASSS